MESQNVIIHHMQGCRQGVNLSHLVWGPGALGGQGLWGARWSPLNKNLFWQWELLTIYTIATTILFIKSRLC